MPGRLSVAEAVLRGSEALCYFRFAEDHQRYLVLFGCAHADAAVTSPEDAAFLALDLTQDEGWDHTNWVVVDRETGEVRTFEQGEFAEWAKNKFVRREA